MISLNLLRNIFITILFAGILSSCISIDRKIRINENGSGEETMAMTLQKEFYDMMGSLSSLMDSSRKQGFLDSLYNDDLFLGKTKAEYDSVQGITIVNISSERKPDSSNVITVIYTFDSIKSIASTLSEMNSDGSDKAETFVTWIDSGNEVMFDYSYEEKLFPGMTETDDSGTDSLTISLKKGMAEMFGGSKMSIEIEFPYEVVSSNANSTNGRILKWDYVIADIMTSGKMQLKAVMKK